MKLLDRAKYYIDNERGGRSNSTTVIDSGSDVAAPLRLLLILTNLLVLVKLKGLFLTEMFLNVYSRNSQ